MRTLKKLYVAGVRVLVKVPPFAGFADPGKRGASYGLRHWAASLLAIYDTRRMAGLDLPWWNVEATREVERFLAANPGARVFEYGAGASTVWLARRAREVISVEHDPEFMGIFRDLLSPYDNVTLLERSIANSPDPYVRAIDEAGGSFDLIVVDGRHRAACLAAAKARLAPGAIVVFDDSGRKRYRDAIGTSGLAERHHFGLSFAVPYPDHTSILAARA